MVDETTTAPPPAVPRTAQRPARAAVLAAALVPALIAFAIGFWGLARGEAMTNDEAATRYAGAFLGVSQLAHLVRHIDAVHALYYGLVHLWSSLTSDSPEALRVPSLIGIALGVLVLGHVASLLSGSVLVIAAAGVVAAVSPYLSYYAQTARSYGLVFLVAMIATAVLLRAIDAGTRGWWVGYAGTVVVLGYLNELGLLAVAAHAVTVLALLRDRATSTRFAVSAGVGVVLVVPLAVVSVRQSGAVSWISPLSSGTFTTLFHDLFGVHLLLGLLVAALAVAGVVFGLRAPRDAPAQDPGPGRVRLVDLALPLALVPPVLLVLVSLVRPVYDRRYMVFAEAGVALLAAAGVAGLVALVPARGAVRALLASGVLVVVGAVLFAGEYGFLDDQRAADARGPDYGTSSAYLQHHYRRGEALVFLDSYYRKMRLGYPERLDRFVDPILARTPQAVGNFRGTDRPGAKARAALRRFARVWTVGPAPYARRPTTSGTRAALALLRARYRVASTKHFNGVVVRLWVRRVGAR